MNKEFSVSNAIINSGVPYEIDTKMEITTTTVTGNSLTQTLYPRQIQVINDCGAKIGWLGITTDEEYLNYSGALMSENFAFVSLPKNSVIDGDIPYYKKFIVKGLESTASAELIITMINYQTR